MKKIWTLAVFLLMVTAFPMCGSEDPALPAELSKESPQPEENKKPGNEEENNDNMIIQIRVGSGNFTVTLAENTTVNEFKNILPLTVAMSDLNRNEKYYYLPVNLPTSVSNPGVIRTGDIMLWGSDCLVIFYKTFSTSYGYTKIGSIEDVSRLESALGSGNVKVTFELVKSE